MSDEKPNKVIEPSPFDKWWAEVQEWRGGRDKNKSAKRLKKAENFNSNRHKRKRRSVGPSLFFVGLMAILELGFGLFKFVLWIAVIGGVVWFLTTVDVEEVTKDAAVEGSKEKVGITSTEVRQKIKDGSTEIIGSIREAINEFTEGWHIEIRTTGEDGEEKMIEFGTKKDEPSTQPEAPE